MAGGMTRQEEEWQVQRPMTGESAFIQEPGPDTLEGQGSGHEDFGIARLKKTQLYSVGNKKTLKDC